MENSYWIFVGIVVVVLIFLCLLLYINNIYRNRRQRMLYRLALGKTAIEESEEDLSSESEDSCEVKEEGNPSTKRVDLEVAREKLWERMEAYMKEKEPYVDPDFDRNVLAKEMYSNISYVSGAINAHGKSFTAWLSEYRVKMAISILQENPKIAVRDLCVKVGVLNPVVFNRQFRNVTGMTVSEFRSQIGK